MRHSCIGGSLVSGRLLAALALAGVFALAPELARAKRCGEELRPLVEAKMVELGVPGVIVQVDAPGVCHWIATLGRGDAT